MPLSKDQIKAIKALEKAQGCLDDAIEAIEKAVELEPCIKGYATYYTIPWLKNFKNDGSRQTGNLDELIQSIEKDAGID